MDYPKRWDHQPLMCPTPRLHGQPVLCLCCTSAPRSSLCQRLQSTGPHPTYLWTQRDSNTQHKDTCKATCKHKMNVHKHPHRQNGANNQQNQQTQKYISEYKRFACHWHFSVVFLFSVSLKPSLDSPQLFPARGICSEPPYPLGPSRTAANVIPAANQYT